MDHVPTLGEYLGEIGWPTPEQLNELMARLSQYLDPLRDAGATIWEKIQSLVQSLEEQLNSWLNQLKEAIWPSFFDDVRKMWQQLQDIAKKTWEIVRNIITDISRLFDMYHDLQEWITVQQQAQQWSADVDAFHKDHGFQYTGRAANRRWIGPGADSYVSVWPDQVKAADRLAKISAETIANLGRLVAVGVACYVAWGMVVLQLVAIAVSDALLSRWVGPAGGGDMRTLLRLFVTAEIAMSAVRNVDEQTARTLTTSLRDRRGLRSRDRNWPNPLADQEFLHPVEENGKIRMQGGPPLRLP
jgi:hypothetical protein